MNIKDQTDFSSFHALDMRVGKVLSAERSKATKLTYRMTADFGADIGIKTTVAAYLHYEPEQLIGQRIIGIMNLRTLKMGPEKSEFFCIGAPNEKGEAIPLTVLESVPLGGQVF